MRSKCNLPEANPAGCLDWPGSDEIGPVPSYHLAGSPSGRLFASQTGSLTPCGGKSDPYSLEGGCVLRAASGRPYRAGADRRADCPRYRPVRVGGQIARATGRCASAGAHCAPLHPYVPTSLRPYRRKKCLTNPELYAITVLAQLVQIIQKGAWFLD